MPRKLLENREGYSGGTAAPHASKRRISERASVREQTHRSGGERIRELSLYRDGSVYEALKKCMPKTDIAENARRDPLSPCKSKRIHRRRRQNCASRSGKRTRGINRAKKDYTPAVDERLRLVFLCRHRNKMPGNYLSILRLCLSRSDSRRLFRL